METLLQFLERCVAQHGARHALRQGARALSYAELYDKALAFGAALDRLGIGKGDVVAVQLPNCIEFVVAYLGVTSRGALLQTLHMPYRAAELAVLLKHSGARSVIAVSEVKDYRAAALMLDLQAQLPELQNVIAVGAPVRGALDFARLCEGGGRAQPVPLSGRDPFLLLYTSGTTAAPKGVPHAYRGFLDNARLSARELSLGPEDMLLSAAPFTHLYGLFTLNMALAVGASALLLPAFSPPELARLIHEGRPTAAFTAPAHLAACLGAGLFEGRDLSSLRYTQISGSAVPPELGRRFEPLMKGGKVMQLWGMTELQAGAFTRLEDAEPVRVETTGRPSPGTELRVARLDGTRADAGEVGELQVRGPSLFAGYLHNDEATRESFTEDGWFRTGDLASMDERGNTRLAGRTRDLINRGGVKFNPLDVENLILRHPAVDQAAIVPMPDPVLGERACLFVTLKPASALTLAEVQFWLESAGVSRVRWPERLEIVDAMPLTPTRKIIKGELVRRLNAQVPLP